jgi:hypothetical protein
VYYQTGTFYNVGVVSQCTTWVTTSTSTCTSHSGTKVAPFISEPEQIAHGFWKANLTGLERLGPNQDWVVGVSVTNLFNNLTDVAPCNSDGTGCYPFDGPFSGINTAVGNSTHPVYIYQNYSQDPRRFEFFLTKKF